MSEVFNHRDWYWAIGDGHDRYWSSASGSFVSSLPEGAGLSMAVSEADLTAALAVYGLPGPVVRQINVPAERDRRLALGFDYDFGDARGVHRINTTPSDMAGWDEVTKLAQALLNIGQTEQPITIATGTGVTQVTPLEWQQVMLAAAAFRQPIWAASFVLEAMDPIPADFADDQHWR